MTRRIRSFLLAAAILAIALPAAGQEAGPRPMPSVPGAAVGSDVFVSVAGLTPGRPITLNFGGLAGYELVARMDVPADGVLATTVRVPDWAERNGVYYFFLNMSGVRVFSDPFIVTGPNGEVQVSGTVSKVEGSCVVMAGADRTNFSLAGITTPPAVAARVTVEGVLGIRPGGEGGAFPCVAHPGIPLRVATVKTGK